MLSLATLPIWNMPPTKLRAFLRTKFSLIKNIETNSDNNATAAPAPKGRAKLTEPMYAPINPAKRVASLEIISAWEKIQSTLSEEPLLSSESTSQASKAPDAKVKASAAITSATINIVMFDDTK